MFKTFIKRTTTMAGALVLASTFFTSSAHAQNWGFSNFGEAFGLSSKNDTVYAVKLRTKYKPGTVLVSFGDRRTYYIQGRGRAISYPIAIPKTDARWSGDYSITRKAVNPTWTPTAEMRVENPKLPRVVAGGHKLNPLGSRALYIGNTLYRIHGTDAPWLIGKAVSHGCIRMHNRHVNDLYRRVRVGARVVITWRRFKS